MMCKECVCGTEHPAKCYDSASWSPFGWDYGENQALHFTQHRDQKQLENVRGIGTSALLKEGCLKRPKIETKKNRARVISSLVIWKEFQ